MTTGRRLERRRCPDPPRPDPLAHGPDVHASTSLWPTLDIADTSKALAAAAAPWTKAVADFTAMQMDALKQMTAPWTALVPGVGARRRADQGPALRRRGVDARTRATRPSPGPTWPRPTCCARRWTPRRSTSAARPSGASRCSQVLDALSPANTLATNPEAMQLAMETGGASLVEGLRLFTEDLARGPHLDDRRVGVRGGPQRRHHAGHRRLPERADPADPVHADHGRRSTSGRW